jgi:hypothetical protein
MRHRLASLPCRVDWINLPTGSLRAKVFVTTSLHTRGFKRGDTVQHAVHGHGTIVSEWGLFSDVDPLDGRRLDVSGAGVFEVRFGQETRSVNGDSLTLVEAAPGIHPFAEKFPKLSSADYEALKASIKQNGLFEPVVVNASGQILDGRHRWQICLELGITPKTISFETLKNAAPNQCLSEERYVYDSNIERRHLTPSQKAAIVLAFLPLARKEAEARRRKAQAKGRATQKANRQSNGVTPCGGPPKWSRGPTTDKILAKRAGVGLPTMKAVIAVNDHAPELLGALANGHLCATEATKLVATKRKQAANGTKPINPAPLEKKTVLRQWEKTWGAFLKLYPVKQHGLVRAIVFEYFRQEKAQ